MTPRPSTKHAILSRHAKDDSADVLRQASLAHQAGRLAEAETGYLELLRRRPDWGRMLNTLGALFLEQSRRDEAKKVFEKAAGLKPPDFQACYNLARLKQQENDHQGAMEIYRAMLAEQPGYGEAWNNLGVAYRETGAQDKAISCFQRAVEFAPAMAEAWNNLGVAQDELNLVKDAAGSYRKAIELRPDYASAHCNLGISLQKLGRLPEAGEHFSKVLETRPDDQAARFMLQSLGTATPPEAAPVEHVRRIFDRCAGTFEKILVKDLEYKTPELLFERVRPYLTQAMHILDLGCGTGLGARLYQPFARELIGVDVSPKMLEKAAAKKIYHRLEVFDILQAWDFPHKFDLIYSSDVFVYFGNLETIIRSAAAYLVPGGLLAFSVEELAAPGMEYRLFPSGRYAHASGYLRACLLRHGLQLLEETPADIRKQSGAQVKGLLLVAKLAD